MSKTQPLEPVGSVTSTFSVFGVSYVYITNNETFRFHNNEFDEMSCKLDSTENPRSFGETSNPTLRQGWVLFGQTWVLAGIQFTVHFIEFVLGETNREKRLFVSNSNVTVIWTRQTCGHRSRRIAGSNPGCSSATQLPSNSKYNRNAHRWCVVIRTPGNAWPKHSCNGPWTHELLF